MLQQQWQEAQTASTDWIAALGAQPDDSDETKLRKRLILIFATVMSLAGLVWGTFAYVLYDSLIATVPPYGYALLTVVNVVWFARSRNFNRFRFIQLALSLLLPFLMMIALGGFVRGSATILWSMIAPLAALLVTSRRQAAYWFVAFVALLLLSAMLEPYVSTLPPVDPTVQTIFFVMNILGPWTAAFVILSSFWLEKERVLRENIMLYQEAQDARLVAEEATLAKSDFLATMSHEIRTPMNAVIGMTSLLLDTELTPDQYEFTATIRDGGESLLSIINDILDFSKMEAGGLELEEQPFDLREAIEASLDLMAVRAAEKGLDLAYLIREEVPEAIVGDVTRLRQILVNLLSNAIKFTEQGEVELSVAVDAPEPGLDPALDPDLLTLHFSVRDSGIGIPVDRMDRLFQSFSQADASTTRRYGGTGLGLVICKRLCEMMGGSIWVESVEGVGSTFHFTVLTVAAPAPQRAYLEEAQPYLEGQRLLIVDDNETNRRMLRLQAEAWGMTCCDVATPAATLEELCNTEAFDVAILDMQMPDMDGLELAAALRNRQASRTLPLILLTSLGGLDAGQRRSAADLELAATLTKPVKSSRLYETLLEVFAERPIRVTQPRPIRTTQFDVEMGNELPLAILLVDDNATNQRLAQRVLDRLGYQADVAANGEEALQALHRQSYDVVLMDIQMPVMDGFAATQQIRQQWPVESRPYIVAMTADALVEEESVCLAAGMDDYVSKPIRVEKLVDALRRAAAAQTLAPMDNSGPVDAGEEIQETVTVPEDELSTGPQSLPVPTPQAEDGGLESLPIDMQALDRLQEIMGGERAYLYELIDSFLEDSPQCVSNLRQGLEHGDAKRVHLAAHTLKANAAEFGAERLRDLNRELEELAKRGTLEDAPDLVTAIEEEYVLVQRALETVRGE